MKKGTERMALMGLLLGIMLILGYIEHLVPLPGREAGIRLGLSNAVLIFAIYMLGVKESFLMMVAKVFLSGFLFSGMQTIMFSLAGGLLSLIAMALAKHIRGISILGVSVAGAFFFNVGQGIVVVWHVQILLSYLPVVFVVGIVSGILTGIVAKLVIQSMKKNGGRTRRA